MPELEAVFCAKPQPKLPVFEQAAADAPWPLALESLAELARRCCRGGPDDRITADQLVELATKAPAMGAETLGSVTA